MKKIIIIGFLLFGFVFGLSQIAVGTSTNDGKWRVGGGIGVNFGNNSYFGFNISPFVGYAISPRIEAGLTTGYQYGKNDFFKSSLFSVGPYSNVYINEAIFGRAHYEFYSGNQKNASNNASRSFSESALWLGGGYQSTGKIRFQAGIMYNVLYDKDDSIFSSPIRPFGGVVLSF